MFKNRFYKAAVLVTLAMSVCSCNKFLELRPQNGITSDAFWQTKEQLQSAVIGIYNNMLTGPAADFFEWGEVRADFVVPGPGVTGDETNIISSNILPSNGIANWGPFYTVINLCNNVIDNAPGVLTKDKTLDPKVLAGYLAEAKTIRALMYFYLVRSFRDVPLKIKYTASDSDVQQLAKSSSDDVLKQVLADLKDAEVNAVATYGNIPSDKGRITVYTVETILADVYLWMDDYANCITYCDKVINSGRFGLVQNTGGTWFNNLYVTQNSIEGIFELQYSTAALNPYFSFFAPSAKPHYLANPSLIDDFYAVDADNPDNFDIRGSDVAIHIADQSIYKYIALSPTSLRTTDASYAHWIFYRYADVLMMKAEACIYSNRGQDALDIIAQIRQRANALPDTEKSPAVTDVQALTDYLVAERAREFAFEGKRWYDLLRNAKRNNFARLDLLVDAAVRSVPPLYASGAISKLHDPNTLYFPVPLGDIQKDPNLVQNPFYK